MGRYDKFGKYLAEKGVLVYGHDHGTYFISDFILCYVSVLLCHVSVL